MNGKQKLLVAGDYGASDESDNEDAQPINEPRKNEVTNIAQGWSVLYDQVSGYPYYWNPTTNEVRWDKPLELEQQKDTNPSQVYDGNKSAKEYTNSSLALKGNVKTYDDGSKNDLPKLVKKSNSNKLLGKAKSKNKRNQDNEKRLFIGPSLPPECSNSASQGKDSKPNEVGIMISEIEDELPPDWKPSTIEAKNNCIDNEQKNDRPHPPSIYKESFTWRKNETLALTVSQVEKNQLRKNSNVNRKPNSIALIAHGYGDDESDNEDDLPSKRETKENMPTEKKRTENVPNKSQTQLISRKRKIDMAVQSKIPAQDQSVQDISASSTVQDGSAHESSSRTNLENVLSDQRKDNDIHLTNNETKNKSFANCDNFQPNTDSIQSKENIGNLMESNQKRKQNISDLNFGPTYKKSIDDIAEMLCDKLESLEVHSIKISPLKLLAIQMETLFEAWHSGALSAAYMQKFLAKMQGEMSQLEIQELAPPGWRVIWNRYSGCLLSLHLYN